MDHIAQSEASSHGRAFPPIPYNDPALPRYADGDVLDPWGVDSPGIPYRWTSAESGFWVNFAKTHPHPPEDIENQQVTIETGILSMRSAASQYSNVPSLGLKSLSQMAKADRTDSLRMGFPEEALSEDALFWAYVLSQRERYQRLSDTDVPGNEIRKGSLLRQLWVDPKYVTEPLTDDQLRTANGWKIPYLQRLRKEKTNETYISAYLEAWNLSPDEVFGATNK
jgi:hypothetical protein